MAGKNKDLWFIGALVVVAAVFVFLAFSRQPNGNVVSPLEKSLRKDPAAEAVLAGQKDAVPVLSLKPEHMPAQSKAVSAMVTPPHEVRSGNNYSIQVYSFKEKSRAEAALKTLKDKNYPGYIMVSDIGERGIWYRVRVGSFSDENEVKRVLQSVVQDFKSGIIVTE